MKGSIVGDRIAAKPTVVEAPSEMEASAPVEHPHEAVKEAKPAKSPRKPASRGGRSRKAVEKVSDQ